MSAQAGGLRMRNVLRTLAGPRLLVVLAVAAAAAVALYASAAPAGKAASSEVQEHPVIDTDFLYSELYFSSTHYIFRVAGADGSPSNPSDVNNLPRELQRSERVLRLVEGRADQHGRRPHGADGQVRHCQRPLRAVLQLERQPDVPVAARRRNGDHSRCFLPGAGGADHGP